MESLKKEVEKSIYEFLKLNKKKDKTEDDLSRINNSTLLIEDGYLDSIKLVELLTTLESKYSIEILDYEDFDVEHVRTIDSIVNLVITIKSNKKV